VPLVILLAFCVLLGVGALDGPAVVTLAWAVLGGLAVGLAYELPARGTEAGALRGEVFSGLSTGAFALAKAAVLLPVLAAADALVLALPAIAGRLHGGFGPAYLAVAISSAVGLAVALAVAVISARRSLPGPAATKGAVAGRDPASRVHYRDHRCRSLTNRARGD
jgi:hypothetical protein